jgi:GNAT superfamily N-acetyltransferase
VDEVTREIEEAFVGHWSHLGRWPRGALVEEDGVLRFETPITHLPYNGVIRSSLGGDPDRTIASVVGSFRRRGVDFMWIVHPSSQPADLGERLAAHGLLAVEVATGMSLDLDDWTPEPGHGDVRYEEVAGELGMRVYEDLIVSYWELPEHARELVTELNRFWGPGRLAAHRWVAFADGRAVGKGLLSLAAPPGVAAIYGMSVLPEARGRGVASGLTAVMLERARALGCRRVVLHSSQMAAGVYRRAGFVERCTFTVYATAPLWSGHDH